jgi:hypothetical protein
MKIIFLQDRDGRTLRKSIAFAPSCQLVHRGVNIASSDLHERRGCGRAPGGEVIGLRRHANILQNKAK